MPTQSILFMRPPSIKSRDTRCSTACVKNWTKYKQMPPIGHYCQCCYKHHK